MKEAVGGGLLFNLVVIFTSIIILLFVAIIAYAKAYGVKNRIVSVVEEYEGYTETAKNVIRSTLKDVGYKSSYSGRCNDTRVKNRVTEMGGNPTKNLNTGGNFDFCIYEVSNTGVQGGKYYIVVTFVSFEFPVIGDKIVYPVYGQTRFLGKKYNYK